MTLVAGMNRTGCCLSDAAAEAAAAAGWEACALGGLRQVIDTAAAATRSRTFRGVHFYEARRRALQGVPFAACT